MDDTFDAYITIYALSTGIEKVPVQLCGHGDMVKFVKRDGYGQYFHVEGKDWHRTKESAVKRAHQMRANMLKTLERSIAKIQALDFEKEVETL